MGFGNLWAVCSRVLRLPSARCGLCRRPSAELIEPLESRRLLSQAAGADSLSQPVEHFPTVQVVADSLRQRAKAYDAGDYRYYFDQKIYSLRLTDEVVLGIDKGVNARALQRRLLGRRGILADFNARPRLNETILRFATKSHEGLGKKRFESLLRRVRKVPGVAWASSSFVEVGNNTRVYFGDKLFVELRPEVNPEAFFSERHLRYSRFLENTYNVRFGRGGTAAMRASVRLFENSPESVLWASPAIFNTVILSAAPNDQLYRSNQWHLKNEGQGSGTPGADINVEPAWDLTTFRSAAASSTA